MPLDPQSAAQTQGQAVAANQASINERAPKLRAEAAEKAKHSAALSNAVSHLNKQTERGEHDPALGWGTAEPQV